jgi:hypothetical protein
MDWGCLCGRSQLDVSEMPEVQLKRQVSFLRVAVKMALGELTMVLLGKSGQRINLSARVTFE